MTSCFILKQTSTKVNLLDSPNTGGWGLSHKPDYHKTPPPLPPNNNALLYFKTIFDKSQPPRFPQHLGGAYFTNRAITKLHFPLLTMILCYILRQTSAKVKLSITPSRGGLSHKPTTTKLHLHLPPYKDAMLYFKTIFDKSQPPPFSQHLGGYLTNRTTTKLHLYFPLPLTMTPCYILKRSLTKVNLPNSPNTWGAISQTGLPQNSTSTSPSPLQ